MTDAPDNLVKFREALLVTVIVYSISWTSMQERNPILTLPATIRVCFAINILPYRKDILFQQDIRYSISLGLLSSIAGMVWI